MYGKIVDGVLQNPPEEIRRSIQAMKDAGFKPVIDSKPGYDVETQDAILVDYFDAGAYIRAMYEIVEIEPTEEEQMIEQTGKAMEMLSVDLAYVVGDRVLYLGVLYKVLQAHTSQAGWEPDITPSLFAKNLIVKDEDGEQVDIPEWTQPDSTNPYMAGDKVMFEGKVYESLIDNNVWSPSAYPQGWQEVVENNEGV